MEDRDAIWQQLCRQIRSGDVVGVQELIRLHGCLEKGLDLNVGCTEEGSLPTSPLMMALMANDPAMVTLLIQQRGIDVKLSLPEYGAWDWVRCASMETLLGFLAYAGDLLNDRDANGEAMLHEAAGEGADAGKVEYLLRQEADPDPKQNDGTTPLYRAARSGNTTAAEALMRYPIDLNNRNTDNLWTVLMVAVAEGHLPVVKLLLSRREVGVNAQSDSMETALHLAAGRGDKASVQALLERRDVRVNEKDRNGWTPLVRAAFSGQTDIVEILCARDDIEVNAVDQDRQTALHWAVLAEQVEVARVLALRPEMNFSITNRPQLQTAYDLAVSMHLEETADLLRHRMDEAKQQDELALGDVYQPRTVEVPVHPIQPAIADPPIDERARWRN